MDYHKEIRHSYLGGFSILFVEGIFWLLAGVLGDLLSLEVGILVIVVGGTFFYPLGLLVQFILKRPKVRKENPLNNLFTQISLMIPFSFPLIFLVTKENINLFFPALTIVVGIHYLPFIYAYKIKSYWMLAILLVVGGSYFGFMGSRNFVFCAYYTGSTLLFFAFIFRFLVRKEIKNKV